MTSFNFRRLNNPPLNAHYEGEYGPDMMKWRDLGATDKAQNIRALLGQRAPEIETVLEAGCGTAVVSLKVAQLGIGKRHVAADITDPTVHAHPGVVEAGIELRTTEGGLPFEDSSFDLVFASHVLEHVPDERGFLAELARVARTWVYIEVPCELNMRNSIAATQVNLEIGHINAYTPESFSLTLQTSGLVPLDIQIFDHSMAIHAFHGGVAKARVKAAMRRTAVKLSPILASRLFTYHVGALCEVEQPSNQTIPKE